MISYPLQESEFEIQAFVYGSLKMLGYDVRGEVCSNDGLCKFDLVVFVNKKPIRVIEVKLRPTKKFIPKYNAKLQKQISRYQGYGVPVDIIQGEQQSRIYIGQIKSSGFEEKEAPPIRPSNIGAKVDSRHRANCKCMSCGNQERIATKSFYSASKPRCSACGGPVKRVGFRVPRASR